MNILCQTFQPQSAAIAGQISIWLTDKMVYPTSGTVDHANSDLPDDIQALYNEARDIVNRSPRGAAALLRLGLQNYADT